MHENEIISMDTHPKRTVVATSSRSSQNNNNNDDLVPIYIWEIDTQKVISCLKGFHIHSIILLQFSLGGNLLISVGDDPDHSIAIYE